MICKLFNTRNQILFHLEMFVVTFLLSIGASYYSGLQGYGFSWGIAVMVVALGFYFHLKKTLGMNG